MKRIRTDSIATGYRGKIPEAQQSVPAPVANDEEAVLPGRTNISHPDCIKAVRDWQRL